MVASKRRKYAKTITNPSDAGYQMRCFVGLSLPESIRDDLCFSARLPGARWTQRQDYHITLHFLGELTPSVADDVHQQLERITDIAPFQTRLIGMDRFAAKRTRSIWAGVENCAELAALHRAVRRALGQAGVAVKSRRFTPHVTLARFTNGPEVHIAQFLVANARCKTEPFVIRQFALFSAHLTRHDEPKYQIEMVYDLGS